MKIMRWVTTLPLRLKSLFLKKNLEDELDEEFQFHLDHKVEELVEAGASIEEARISAKKALGVERHKEKCRDVRAGQWLGSLWADVIFGWRQLMKRKVTTAAAVLSLGLAIGACTSAFRLVDALFFRPMPVSHPDRLYGVFREGMGFRDGKPNTERSFEYPVFKQMRDAVKDQATVIGVSGLRKDVTFAGVEEMEKTQIAYVSGSMFGAFGLKPALGRLLTESDDDKAGAHPYAVLSYDYWTRRFGRDPHVIGRTLHMGDSAVEMGNNVYQIVGVGPKGFTGTEPGTVTDIFLPATMYIGVKYPEWSWINLLVALKPGSTEGPVADRLEAVYQADQRERAKGFSGRSSQFFTRFLSWHTKLEPAPTGVSRTQEDYRLPLGVLSFLVAMVLLIACVNVANLMSAQAAARAREMAVRVSMGAGHGRLVRLVMVESGMVGLASAALGFVIAWQAAPFVVTQISTPQHPVRLVLGANWTVLAFGIALALGVTLFFGVIPALRASSIEPVTALKGGEDPETKSRLMHSLIGAQVAFCFVVLFVAGLFMATFTNLMQRPLGFAAQGLVVIDTTATHSMPATVWEQTAEMLRHAPGVEQVGLSLSALLSGNSFGSFITVNGATSPELVQTLTVSPGWLGVMHIPLIDGRDLTERDGTAGVPPVALVSRTFARDYFGSVNAVGRTFVPTGSKKPVTVVGVVGDVLYQNVREVNAPVFYMPYQQVDDQGVPVPMRNGAFNVRVTGNDPAALAETLRRMVVQARPEFRIYSVRTEEEMIASQTVRERLLATLGVFFAAVALLLAAVGLYGVLYYSVIQREREIGIRIALGAAVGNIARLVTLRVFAMVLAGAVVGVALGMASVRYVATLLYGVKGYDPAMLVLPAFVLLTVALLAALPA
ncbi:MAG TPA: ADOP family duplicated permease, partial [Edaphobacter sp.]|nr:ADOP family duplicated permease [Edaphobacter sp.]